jgi:hypothetical protein
MRLAYRIGLTFVLALALCAMAASGQPVAHGADGADATPVLVAPDAQVAAAGLSETLRTGLEITAAPTPRGQDECHRARTSAGAIASAALCRARARDTAARDLGSWLALARSGFLSTSSATPPPAIA